MRPSLLSLCFIVSVAIDTILADIYLHNPRGSNNRHNEPNRERNNAQLSFDSQNNNRGGYNVGDDGAMYYYTKSILPIEWTNQHSCNDVNADCTLLLQYTCSDALRDGETTEIIPVSVEGENNATYRLNEDLKSYLNCRVRSRDKNLFVANQGLQGDASIYTRQNPNGKQHGYECPEERDYYPHWQPNDWIDIAVLTNRQDLCAYYRQNSQNVQSRYACTFEKKDELIKANSKGVILPNNKEACESFNITGLDVSKPRWLEYPSHNKPAPECYSPSYTRENHLGDIHGSGMSTFNWTLPDTSAKKCVLRIRYNISTADYDGWNTDAKSNRGNLYIMNGSFPNASVAEKRGYRYQGNPKIKLFDDLNVTFQLAINTAQYGRVFEDRSFTFEIRSRTAEMGNKPIYNLNVRGRRGNIVQVYPAVEYDFVPNRLEISPSSYVHIQWIGSNTTPPGAGQGNKEIDRNNLLLLDNKVMNTNWNPFKYLNSSSTLIANTPVLLNGSKFLNLARNDLRRLAASGENTDPLLNNASAYFDLGARLVPLTASGVYHYVSTRNNDFSNRDQKGRITVQPFPYTYQLVGQNVQTISLDDVILVIPANAVINTTSLKLIRITSKQLATMLPVNGHNIVSKRTLHEDVYIIEPYDLRFLSKVEFQIPFGKFNNEESTIDVLQFEPEKGVYMKLPITLDSRNRLLKFQSDIGGAFAFVKSRKSTIWIAGIIIPLGLVMIIVISTIIYFRLSPTRYTRVKDQLTKTKRSFFSRI